MINTVESQKYHLAALEEGQTWGQALVQMPQESGWVSFAGVWEAC